MKNYLDFEKEIKALEQEVDGLKSPFGSEGISEVDTDKIKNTQQEINKKLESQLGSKSRRKLSVKITDGKEFSEIKEGLGFKKIIKGVQGNLPKGTTSIHVEYVNRKGTTVSRQVAVPMGRKKKIGR